MSFLRYSGINRSWLCLFLIFFGFHHHLFTMKSLVFVVYMLNFNKSKIDDFPENKTKKVELRELVVPL